LGKLNVMTVCGEKKIDDLSVILPHEHIFIDISNQFTEPVTPFEKKLAYQKVNMNNLGYLRRDPYVVKDNLILSEYDVAYSEIITFKDSGGQSIIDVTPVGIGRDPNQLQQLMKETGVNIIAGCGFYTHDTHTTDIEKRSAEDITELIMNDLLIGMDHTGVRSGVIGEIGTSQQIHPNEKKVLQAAGKAQSQSRIPVFIHVYPWSENGIEVLDILESEGADPSQIVICHSDVEMNLNYMISVMKRGAFIEFDNFGKEFWIPIEKRKFAGGNFATDRDRVQVIRKLVDLGYQNRLLITNDICLKAMLHAYGGWGYDHILSNVVPMLIEVGVEEKIVWEIIIKNPQQLFLR
jgi:phosphotriesterase-related protein